MKQKLLCLLVLLLTATTGAMAQAAITTDLADSYDAKVGIPITLSIEASNAQYYQWYKKLPQADAMILGATSPSYEFTPKEAGETKFFCRVIGYNNDLAESKVTIVKATVPQTYSITLAEGTEDAGKWTISPTEAAEGSPVTTTYSGEKKVKSVKAVKVAGDTGKSLAEATVGMIIGSNGKAYAADDKDNLPEGVTVAAKVCYVDGNGHGLALALTDEVDKMNWSTAQTTCDAHTPAITGGKWMLASKGEWNNMISAAGSYSALRDGFSSVGGTNMQLEGYWSSTEDDSSDAWNYYFSNGLWSDVSKSWKRCVRACLAF